jgi:hypothetical protein
MIYKKPPVKIVNRNRATTPKITWTLNGRDLPKTGGTGG